MSSSCKEGLTFCTISSEALWVKVGVVVCVSLCGLNGHKGHNHLCNLLDLPLMKHFHRHSEMRGKQWEQQKYCSEKLCPPSK